MADIPEVAVVAGDTSLVGAVLHEPVLGALAVEEHGQCLVVPVPVGVPRLVALAEVAADGLEAVLRLHVEALLAGNNDVASRRIVGSNGEAEGRVVQFVGIEAAALLLPRLAAVVRVPQRAVGDTAPAAVLASPAVAHHVEVVALAGDGHCARVIAVGQILWLSPGLSAVG